MTLPLPSINGCKDCKGSTAGVCAAHSNTTYWFGNVDWDKHIVGEGGSLKVVLLEGDEIKQVKDEFVSWLKEEFKKLYDEVSYRDKIIQDLEQAYIQEAFKAAQMREMSKAWKRSAKWHRIKLKPKEFRWFRYLKGEVRTK